jgi:hypothetical protein
MLDPGVTGRFLASTKPPPPPPPPKEFAPPPPPATINISRNFTPLGTVNVPGPVAVND